jgi:hypothetical protein
MLAAIRLATLGASSLVLLGCSVTRIELPVLPSTSQVEQADHALGGDPADVAFTNGETVDREGVHAATIVTGDLVYSRVAQPASPSDWTTVPLAKVDRISTVDPMRGALKGLLGGFLGGLALTGGLTVAALSSCDEQAFCSGSNAGQLLLAGAIVGSVVGIVTGGVGFLTGLAVGDGAVVTINPDASTSDLRASPSPSRR